MNKSGVDVTFLDDVSRGLTNGKFAVLAEIKESWTTPVDTRVQEGDVDPALVHVEDEAREAAE